MNFAYLAHAALLLLLSIGACTPRPTDNLVLASIDSEQLHLLDLSLSLAQVPRLREASNEQQRKAALAALESLIDDRVLYLEAKKRGLSISDEAIEHEMRQHEALLGRWNSAHFRQKLLLSQDRLRLLYRRQLLALQYLSHMRKEGISLCEEGLRVQSSQNCIKRKDFFFKLRKNYRISRDEDSIKVALQAIVESAK